MSKSQSSASVKPAASVIEELARTDARHWQSVVSRVEDPITARLLVNLLDTMPDLRTERLGVYLAASETVKRDQIRWAKNYRLGKSVGIAVKLFISTLTGTTLAIARGLRWLAKTCGLRMSSNRPAVASAAVAGVAGSREPAVTVGPAGPARAGVFEWVTPNGLLIVVDHFGALEEGVEMAV